MATCYIGIDNGVTGSIGVITKYKSKLYPVPTFKQLSYTKKKNYISRIDILKLKYILTSVEDSFVLIERPMINPARFTASLSAIRALEATQIVLDELSIPYAFIDSKEWQKALLPSGLKGAELKAASIDIGGRLFPHLTKEIKKQKDADGILIAEYCRKTR